MSDEQVLGNAPPAKGPDGSPPGHIDKMLGKKTDDQQQGDQTGDQQGDQQVTQRPDDIPEKFWDAEKGAVNVEALLKAQQDGEAALRKAQQGDNEGNDDGNEGKEGDDNTPNQAGVVEAASAEWAEKGELSDETYKSLEGVGLSREMVNAYIDGQMAVIGNLQAAAYEPFEGQEGYDKAANWAAENLSEAEIAAIDVQLTSTNPAIVAQGAKALFDRYSKEADIEPSAIRGNANSSTDGSVYHSRAEMIKDMGSARYRTDAGFRREVAEKLRRSKL